MAVLLVQPFFILYHIPTRTSTVCENFRLHFQRRSTRVEPTFPTPFFWVLLGCYLVATYRFSEFSTTSQKNKKPRRIALRGDFSYSPSWDKIISLRTASALRKQSCGLFLAMTAATVLRGLLSMKNKKYLCISKGTLKSDNKIISLITQGTLASR